MSVSGNGNGNGNKKKVRCIICGKEWEKECNGFFNFEVNGGVSGTLCDACEALRVTPIIRRRQIKEGNFDCFLRATHGFCARKKQTTTFRR